MVADWLLAFGDRRLGVGGTMRGAASFWRIPAKTERLG